MTLVLIFRKKLLLEVLRHPMSTKTFFEYFIEKCEPYSTWMLVNTLGTSSLIFLFLHRSLIRLGFDVDVATEEKFVPVNYINQERVYGAWVCMGFSGWNTAKVIFCL